jgi:four helix bundle protein
VDGARELTNAVYAGTREGAFARDFGLVDQMRRAAVSAARKGKNYLAFADGVGIIEP